MGSLAQCPMERFSLPSVATTMIPSVERQITGSGNVVVHARSMGVGFLFMNRGMLVTSAVRLMLRRCAYVASGMTHWCSQKRQNM